MKTNSQDRSVNPTTYTYVSRGDFPNLLRLEGHNKKNVTARMQQ
jgi:hypothetical protein